MTGFRNHTKIGKTDNRGREEIQEVRTGNRVQDRQQIPNRLQEVAEVRTENTNSTNCFRCLMLEHS
jgi:hypothetical protein